MTRTSHGCGTSRTCRRARAVSPLVDAGRRRGSRHRETRACRRADSFDFGCASTDPARRAWRLPRRSRDDASGHPLSRADRTTHRGIPGRSAMSRTAVEAWESGYAYERYVGRWSRKVALEFLRWLAPGPSLAWADVGCGTGELTSVI